MIRLESLLRCYHFFSNLSSLTSHECTDAERRQSVWFNVGAWEAERPGCRGASLS